MLFGSILGTRKSAAYTECFSCVCEEKVCPQRKNTCANQCARSVRLILDVRMCAVCLSKQKREKSKTAADLKFGCSVN